MTQEIQEILEKKPTYEEEISRLKEAIHHFMKQVFFERMFIFYNDFRLNSQIM